MLLFESKHGVFWRQGELAHSSMSSSQSSPKNPLEQVHKKVSIVFLMSSGTLAPLGLYEMPAITQSSSVALPRTLKMASQSDPGRPVVGTVT